MQSVRAHNRAVHLSRFSLELFLTCASQASQCQRCACNSASSAYARASASTDLASAALASHFLISPTMNSTAVGKLASTGGGGAPVGSGWWPVGRACPWPVGKACPWWSLLAAPLAPDQPAVACHRGIHWLRPLGIAPRGPCAAERVGRTAENGPTLITTRCACAWTCRAARNGGNEWAASCGRVEQHSFDHHKRQRPWTVQIPAAAQHFGMDRADSSPCLR